MLPMTDVTYIHSFTSTYKSISYILQSKMWRKSQDLDDSIRWKRAMELWNVAKNTVRTKSYRCPYHSYQNPHSCSM